MVDLFQSSRKKSGQDNLSLSTFKAEFVTDSQAGQEALYLRKTLKDFGYQQQNATKSTRIIWPVLP